MKRLSYIHARISKEESDLLNLIAMQKGKNLSETIRYFIRSEIERNGLFTDSSKSSLNDSKYLLDNNSSSISSR